MSLRHVLDCFPSSAKQACIEMGVQYRDVPMDGKPHDALLVNDSHGDFVGGITRSPDGVCGTVFNKKTGKSIIFFIREALPIVNEPVKIKNTPKKLTSKQIRFKAYLREMKAILDSGDFQ